MNSKLNTNLIKFSATEFPVLSRRSPDDCDSIDKIKIRFTPEHVEHPTPERNINRNAEIKAFEGCWLGCEMVSVNRFVNFNIV